MTTFLQCPRRPILSLPGFHKADHAPAVGNAASGAQGGTQKPGTDLPRALTAEQHTAAMAELAQALNAALHELPAVFAGLSPRPLALGVHEALGERYPYADRQGLRTWLAAWVGTPAYLHRLSMGGARHSPGGQAVGAVTAREKQHAKRRLKQLSRMGV